MAKDDPPKAEVAHQVDQTDGHRDLRKAKDGPQEVQVARQVNRVDR
ncbi:MAG: hypothetical protein ACKOEO_10480 [Planctomycetaceae bacterium]